MRGLETGVAILQASGLEVLELDRGYSRVRMPFAINSNHVDTFYAGSLFVLAEVTGAALYSGSFDSKHFYPIVKDMEIRFVRPASSDVTAEARLSDTEIAELQARVKRDGKADHHWECELRDANGVVVAVTRNVFQLRAKAGSKEEDASR
jgi:acyl-coenzyme A thioesterase PaaI-like protein